MKKIAAAIGLIINISFISAAHSQESVLSYDAIPDDNIDDTSALQDAFDNASGILQFPDGVYDVSGNLTIDNPNLIAMSINHQTAIIRSGETNGNKIIIERLNKFQKFKLDGVRLVVDGSSTSNASDRYIRWNRFVNTISPKFCIELDDNNGIPANLIISTNQFYDCNAAVTGFLSDSIIDSNVSDGMNRHYRMLGSTDVEYTNNTMYDGIVGILFIHTIDGGEVSGNLIEDNIIDGASEEGISFDGHAGNALSYLRWNGVLETYTASGGYVTALHTTQAGSGIDIADLQGHTLVFLEDGAAPALKGEMTTVTGVSSSGGVTTLTVDGTIPESAIYSGGSGPNAKAVALAFKVTDNQVLDNTLVYVGRTGIGLHGAGIDTLIDGNEVYACNTESAPPAKTAIWGGIVLRNLNYAGATEGEHGPVFHNTVENNLLQGSNCDLKAFTKDYSNGQSTPLYHAIGNTKASNTFQNGANDTAWTNQE